MRKRIFILILAILILFTIYYINRDSSIPFVDINDEPKTIVLITKMRYGGYWQSVVKGAEAAEKEFGVTLVYDAPNEETDIEGQIEMVNFYIDEGVDGIVLAASDYEALVPAVERATSMGIPVVLIDSHVKTDQYYKRFSTNNFEVGMQAAEVILDLAGPDARVGVVSFVRGSENAMEREKGLRHVLDKYPEVQILDTKYCMSSIEMAETHAMVFLDQEVDVIIGLNAIATTGIGRALSLYGDAVGIGFDSTIEVLTLLDQGVLDATIVQNPYGMGYLGVKYAAMIDDEYPEQENYIDTFVITPDNMFLKENQKLVFPFNVE